MIPGQGEPVSDAALLFEGGTIHYAGPRAGVPAGEAELLGKVLVVMPGLWDCHTHLVGLPPASPFSLALALTEPSALRGARCASDLRAALDAGVTSVREVGGLGAELAVAVAEGSLLGPTVYGAGSALSMTAGHGDVHSLPLPWVDDQCDSSRGFSRLCDGSDECMKATREQLRKNAKVIKVCASGGVISELDDPIHQQFTVSELRTIVETARFAERVVAAHCHGKAGIMAAIEAGVRTIEHGTYLDEEACDAMRETGTILVPTLLMAATPHVPGKSARVFEKSLAVVERSPKAVALAHSRGVTIAAGTDICLAAHIGSPISWGRHGSGLPLMVGAGLTALEAIETATANAPLTLGPQAPLSGQLAPQYDADFIALAADPIADIHVLANPAQITGVWKAGVRVKG
jgi:imidazolonepropionase-like amidohydrolase